MKETSNSLEIDVFDYDFHNDSLLFSYSGIKYDYSVELGDIIVDFGDNGLPIGAEILDASELFNIPKSAIKNGITKFDVNFSISKEAIEVTFILIVTLRNQEITKIATSHVINDIDAPTAQIAMTC
jgi:uncharacterized protein YuzE